MLCTVSHAPRHTQHSRETGELHALHSFTRTWSHTRIRRCPTHGIDHPLCQLLVPDLALDPVCTHMHTGPTAMQQFLIVVFVWNFVFFTPCLPLLWRGAIL
jgi:hypothetical protein